MGIRVRLKRTLGKYGGKYGTSYQYFSKVLKCVCVCQVVKKRMKKAIRTINVWIYLHILVALGLHVTLGCTNVLTKFF